MANRNGIANAEARKVPVTSTEFSQRFSSKQECYRFVASECKIALDDFKVTSIHHLRDIVSGNRKTIKSADLQHIHVPHFTNLSVEKMLEWAKQYPEVFQVLPVEQSEIAVLHR